MMYKPDLYVYLWLLPVIVIFIAPFLIIPAAQLWEKLLAAGSSLQAVSVSQLTSNVQDYEMEQRRHPRQVVDGLVAHVSDGVNYCRGAVQDVSKEGICIVSTEGKLGEGAEKLGVLLTGPGKSFQMLVTPVWKQGDGQEKNIGAIIEDSLGNWPEYAECLQPSQAAG